MSHIHAPSQTDAAIPPHSCGDSDCTCALHDHGHEHLQNDACPHSGMTALDKAGVCLSGLCAVHCVLTPVLLSIWPMFGEIWGGTATHWIIAGFVVPLAAVAFAMGYRHHRRVWIPMLASAGVALILIAMLAPGISHHHHIADTPDTHNHDTAHDHSEDAHAAGKEDTHATMLSESAVTIAGSVLLILAHVANLRLAKCACKAR